MWMHSVLWPHSCTQLFFGAAEMTARRKVEVIEPIAVSHLNAAHKVPKWHLTVMATIVSRTLSRQEMLSAPIANDLRQLPANIYWFISRWSILLFWLYRRARYARHKCVDHYRLLLHYRLVELIVWDAGLALWLLYCNNIDSFQIVW